MVKEERNAKERKPEIEAIPFVPVSRASIIDICLSRNMPFSSHLKVSRSTLFPLLPFTLLSLGCNHKLLNIKPCFQSVRLASRSQGPSHPLLHFQRHLYEKSTSVHIPLTHISTCITQPPPISNHGQGNVIA